MALQKLVRFLAFFSQASMIMALSQERAVAEEEFPFEAVNTGELVEGYQFWDIAFEASEVKRNEVMVTGRDGAVVFPADLKFSLPLLKVFYEKLVSGKKQNGEAESAAVELIRLITPRNTYQLKLHPGIDSPNFAIAAGYLGIEPERIRILANEWSQQAKDVEKDARSGRVNIITMMSGNMIRQYKLVLNEAGDKLESISITASKQIPFAEGRSRPGDNGILPIPQEGDPSTAVRALVKEVREGKAWGVVIAPKELVEEGTPRKLVGNQIAQFFEDTESLAKFLAVLEDGENRPVREKERYERGDASMSQYTIIFLMEKSATTLRFAPSLYIYPKGEMEMYIDNVGSFWLNPTAVKFIKERWMTLK